MSARLGIIRANLPPIAGLFASWTIRFSRRLRGMPRMQQNARAVFGQSGPSRYGNTSREGDTRARGLNVGTQRVSWVDTIRSLTVGCHEDDLCLHSASLLR
jgi:hypothetical protein